MHAFVRAQLHVYLYTQVIDNENCELLFNVAHLFVCTHIYILTHPYIQVDVHFQITS